jgi:hypothetical protein
MRPSGESAGWATESGNLVSWTHWEQSGGRAGPRDQKTTPFALTNAALLSRPSTKHSAAYLQYVATTIPVPIIPGSGP